MRLKYVLRVLVYIWRTKKVWRKPARAKVLIYDRCGSDTLLEYLDPIAVAILDTRGESVNVYVLLKMLLARQLGRTGYVQQYLRCVQPAVAITLIDNNPEFYRLKRLMPELTTIFLQNGTRGELGDVFGTLTPQHDFHVDYMLVHGRAIGREYQKSISGRYVTIGSIRNNFVEKRSLAVRKASVLFVSQYLDPPSKSSESILVEPNGTAIFWDQFFASEELILRFLSHYCTQHKLILVVCGRLNVSDGSEYAFFKEKLGDSAWEFIPQSGKYGSYQLVESVEIVVFVDSTLGYEALGRGQRTACFSIRDFTLHNKATKFGWPAKLPDNGHFWTNHADEREFERVMDYVTTVSDEEWEDTRREYVSELMEFDPGNTRFLKLMHELGVSLTGA